MKTSYTYTRKAQTILQSLLTFLAIFCVLPAMLFAAPRLYFTSIVEHDTITDTPHVLLRWGALEGNIPSEITSFTLYRKNGTENFEHLATIPHGLLSAENLGKTIGSDWNEGRFQELLALLNEISESLPSQGPVVTESNFQTFLHQILDEQSSLFNPLQRHLFSRYHQGIAMSIGLGYDDTTAVTGQSYIYMLTATTASGESLPIGQSGLIDPAVPTVLPAPHDFHQVTIGDCSAFAGNLDDLNIHFSWSLPSAPQDIGQNILTYGYDIFWAESELNSATIDLNLEIPQELHKANPKPIVIAGPPSAEANFLGKDDGSSHGTGPAWQRGQQYYYYLASRDITGRYSALASLVDTTATVIDRQPPVAPWRLHVEESSLVDAGEASPQMSLVWDKITPLSYVRYFGHDRAICSITENQVCMADTEDECAQPQNIRCVDTGVVSYDVFRFASEVDAASWGDDSDGDLWPDYIETNTGYNKCNGEEMPTGTAPIQHLLTIDQTDTTYQRTLNNGTVQIIYTDTGLNSSVYDQVFFYRVVAKDASGNASPVSPPIQAVLHDRNQPTADGSLYKYDCDNFLTTHTTKATEHTETDDLLTIVDNSGQAASYKLFVRCNIGGDGTTGLPVIQTTELAAGEMINGVAHITPQSIAQMYCDTPPCLGQSFVVVFYNDYGLPLNPLPTFYVAGTPTGDFIMIDLCSTYSGTVFLHPTCVWTEIQSPNQVASGPVQICAPLQEGENARIYQKIGGEMSPVATLAYEPDATYNDQSCLEIADLAGLVTADLCMGVRIFSQNHVGSAMHYLHCLEMKKPDETAKEPPPPILEGLYSRTSPEGDPSLELFWAAPKEGQAAFVMSMRSGETSRMKSVFPTEKNDSGQFSYTLPLTTEELEDQWCVKARTITTAMVQSPWSAETCGTWQETEPENLAWPRQSSKLIKDDITAFLLKEGDTSLARRPALVLSDNLTMLVAAAQCGIEICADTQEPCVGATGQSCLLSMQACSGNDQCLECDGSGLCVERIYDDVNDISYDKPAIFAHHNLCSYLQPLAKARNFMVYRQQEGENFVQVSPLVEGFSCKQSQLSTKNGYINYSMLRDPFYTFRNLTEDAVIGSTPDGSPIDPVLAKGPRLFYLDHYPATAGMTIRYKIIIFDEASGEPKKELTSNWLVLN